jgi:hypothetical protein
MGAGCYVVVAVKVGSSACMGGGRATTRGFGRWRAAARNENVSTAGIGAAVMIGDTEYSLGPVKAWFRGRTAGVLVGAS